MTYPLRLSLFSAASVLAPALALVTALGAPAEARACSPDECEWSDRWIYVEPVHEVVAIDGVLVFRYERGNGLELTDEEALAYLTLDVTDTNGPVGGAIELAPDWRALVWRPDVPFAPGESLTASVVIDNASIDETFCAEDIDMMFELTVADEALAPLEVPAFEIEEEVSISEVRSLGSLVCCDGAYPYEEEICGWSDLIWDDGACTSTEGVGRLSAGYDWPAGESEATLADRAYKLTSGVKFAGTDGTLVAGGSEPFCITPRVYSFAFGMEMAASEVCYGDDVIEQLGEQEIDPTVALDGACEGELYTCALIPNDDGYNGQKWDENDCEPFDAPGTGSDTDSGGSDSGSTSSDSDSATDGSATDGSTAGPGTGGSDGSGSNGDTEEDSDTGVGAQNGCGCRSDGDGDGSGGLPALLALLALPVLRRRR